MRYFRVIRFCNRGLRETHELGFCEDLPDARVKITYVDREVECRAMEIASSFNVNWSNMKHKAPVRNAVLANYEPLRTKLGVQHTEIDELALHFTTAAQVDRRRVERPVRVPQDEAAKDLMAFVTETRMKRCPRIQYLRQLVPLQLHRSKRMRPTSRIKKPIAIKGMHLIDLKARKTIVQVNELCRKAKLMVPDKFAKQHALFYGHKDSDGVIDSVLGVSLYNLNKTPGSICVSVELAVSINKGHAMSTAINSIKDLMRKRRNLCVLTTQSADTAVARDFWSGKLTSASRASIMSILLHKFDARNTIYADTVDMAAFYGE